jgi:hypothetical protein
MLKGVPKKRWFVGSLRNFSRFCARRIRHRFRLPGFFFATFFFARFLTVEPFLADFTFDVFAAFLREVGVAFLPPPDFDYDAPEDSVDFFCDRPSDVFALATDFSASIGVPLRISSPIVSAVLATRQGSGVVRSLVGPRLPPGGGGN